ncbi:SET domain-containing protein [Delitschia confertaspora ATCC 74209]|uniref:SET domain-containing protein n=1 Tax=Delitschia confertaspora ATCC 74209 TaxID=1513339 RepID=A0A9P4MR03_9PLEO|nr:SET domain-containing protein [Delitschia confertaspora ATCC 74209]
MIRRGRLEGWLKRSIDDLPRWAAINGVSFRGIKIGPLPGLENRGSTVIAKQELRSEKEGPLMVVPKDLIISRLNIDLFAKSDQQLKEVLEAVGEFGHTTRGAVLIFLLMQATISCPDIHDVGVLNPLTEYIKFLPDELLPTFWTEEEQELLVGTTLRPAVRAKFNSLLREFEHLRTSTQEIEWCAKYWWDEDEGQVTFEDWMSVDAMYRSRALEFPRIGDSMVPCVDMANHASGDATVALFESDEDGNGLLLLRDGKDKRAEEEITITYGDEKGACEMIFSYGFLEDNVTSARMMFLNLDIPGDDPLRPAKIAVNSAAPGFRIFEKEDGITAWESDFIWLVCVNEEDGLDFKFMQTVDGDQEIMTFWGQKELENTLKLKSLLQQEPLWDVYQLRAVCLLQDRVERQIETLEEMGEPEKGPTIREVPWQLAGRLRKLEGSMLERCRRDLEDQKTKLLDSGVVRQYLGISEEPNEEVDFS